MAGYPIEIVEYDPSWPSAFAQEVLRLQPAIGRSVIKFEHMGSTSVAGLESKPIIDIAAAVATLTSVPDLFGPLAELGYKPIEQRSKDRYDLWRLSERGFPSHILHFMEFGSAAWIRPIIFRNALRADSNLRMKYSELKRTLANNCGSDILAYGTGKTEFINKVIDEILGEEASV